jgi:hypothetical protein
MGQKGPIYKVVMEEAPSGAASLGDEPPIPNIRHHSRTSKPSNKNI